MPKSLTLHSNYPNPFNGRTSVKIDIDKDNAGYIDLDVYDISGRKIDSIIMGLLIRKSHTFLGCFKFFCGIYFLNSVQKFTANNQIAVC